MLALERLKKLLTQSVKSDAYCLIVFKTTYETLRAEKLFKKNNTKCKIIIKPRVISSSCNLAIIIDPDFLDQALEIFKTNLLKPLNLFRIIDDNIIEIDFKAIEKNWRDDEK